MERLPDPKLVYTARWPLTLTHIGQDLMVRVEPPVKLAAGESVTLWWFIEGGRLRYHHSGSPTR
jgi:hypothetical protein